MLGSLLFDYCWVCSKRFKTSVPPGPANREDHHMVPQNAGGTDGPQVSLCDSHHTVIHKIAIRLKSGKQFKDFLNGEDKTSVKKLLWLATLIVKSERLVVNDPNKSFSSGISLSKTDIAMLNRLRKVFPKSSRSDLLKAGLNILYKKYF